MTKEEMNNRVIELVKQKKGKVIGKNVLSAVFALFSNPLDTLGKLYFGIESDLSDERLKVEQRLMLELIIDISETLESFKSKITLNTLESKSIILDGINEVQTTNSENVIGVHIGDSSQPVEFKPGTKISVKSKGCSNTTGLKIGD